MPDLECDTTEAARTDSPLMRLLKQLELQSFFELSDADRALWMRVETDYACTTQEWSFVAHPDAVRLFIPGDKEQHRHLVVIETLRARVYDRVRKFLSSYTTNVKSYYTGGSADFICDVFLSDESYSVFYDRLVQELKSSGAGKLKDLKKLICVYRVDEELILARKNMSSMGRPDPGVMRTIQADLATFALVYSNYRSPATIQRLGGEMAVQRYLESLVRGKVLLGYKPAFHQCQYIDREYVPLCNGRALDRLVADGMPDDDPVLRPTVELLKVAPIQATDDTEKEVTHVFINDYRSPLERNAWRAAIYSEVADDANVFTFPLEGTIHEAPHVLSDLPDVLVAASHYAGDIKLGTLHHASIVASPPQINIHREAFAYQGVTFGLPGTGKTNTDCVLIEQAQKAGLGVLVIDGKKSRSIREKTANARDELRSLIKYLDIPESATYADIRSVVSAASPGIRVLEVADGNAVNTLRACLDMIEEGTSTSGNDSRVVDYLLLVEEANDALGSGTERVQQVAHLERALNKAFRKGWCIWLSTQQPSHLGYDADSAAKLLDLFGNIIIHQLGKVQVDALRTTLLLTADKPRTARLVTEATSLPKGKAIVRGAADDAGQLRLLPPVVTSINLLGAESNVPGATER